MERTSRIDMGVPGEFGMVCDIKKQRRKRQKLLIIDLLLDFAKNTTLHGLRYITDVGLSLKEKIFWAITFLISLGLCSMLIGNVWYKWRHSPVIVSFNEEMISVNEVPFPSVTICPQWKCKKTEYLYEKYYKKFYPVDYFYSTYETHDHNHTDEAEKIMLEDATLICDKKNRHLLDRNVSDESLIDHIRTISPNVYDVFGRCKWRSKTFWCDEIFNEILTQEGVCFNFNSLSHEDMFRNGSLQPNYTNTDYTSNNIKNWDFKYGYNTTNYSVYAYRGQENGASPDLEFVLYEYTANNDDKCNTLSNGFKIYLHHPADMPQSSLYYYAAIPGQVTSLALKFSVFNTTANLEKYGSEQRQCYFPADGQLDYFNIYTPSNCRIECFSKYTYKRCGCVWFHMPHPNRSEICTASKRSCVMKAIDEVASKSKKFEVDKICNCLPSCVSVQYDAEILKTTFDFKKDLMVRMRKYNDSNKKPSFTDGFWDDYNISKVELYFKEPRFVSMRRSELFGVTDFLANIGGLLGLFLGFSFLSLVEIFYFCTLRMWRTLKKDIKTEKKRFKESKYVR